MTDPVQINDPARIRALAHPLRLALLDLLDDLPEATATDCAARLGESVASCSFHLRTLERYGFVERGTRRGKEKPWRLVTKSWDVRPDPDAPSSPNGPSTLGSGASTRAMTELATILVGREAERLRAFIAQIQAEKTAWVNASTISTSSFWATAEETAELSETVRNLSERFRDRHEDPASRPPGARRVRLFATVNPDPTDEVRDDGAADG